MAAASRIHFQSRNSPPDSVVPNEKSNRREQARTTAVRLTELLVDDGALARRFQNVGRFARRVRVSEYHLTNACNIRCKGCWFFEYGHDRETNEAKDPARWEQFVTSERDKRKVNCALIIGGEPSLFMDRLRIDRKSTRLNSSHG